VRDAEAREDELERAGGERRAVVGAQRERPRREAAHGDGVLDERDRLGGAAAQLEVPADDLARAAVDRGHQVAPAVLGDPDRRHVQVPELVRPRHGEEAGPPTPVEPAAALDQAPLKDNQTDGYRMVTALVVRMTRSTRLRLTARPSLRRLDVIAGRARSLRGQRPGRGRSPGG